MKILSICIPAVIMSIFITSYTFAQMPNAMVPGLNEILDAEMATDGSTWYLCQNQLIHVTFDTENNANVADHWLMGPEIALTLSDDDSPVLLIGGDHVGLDAGFGIVFSETFSIVDVPIGASCVPIKIEHAAGSEYNVLVELEATDEYRVVRIDADGTVIWQQDFFVFKTPDRQADFISLPDGGCVVASWREINQRVCPLIVRIDADGNIIWQWNYDIYFYWEYGEKIALVRQQIPELFKFIYGPEHDLYILAVDGATGVSHSSSYFPNPVWYDGTFTFSSAAEFGNHIMITGIFQPAFGGTNKKETVVGILYFAGRLQYAHRLPGTNAFDDHGWSKVMVRPDDQGIIMSSLRRPGVYSDYTEYGQFNIVDIYQYDFFSARLQVNGSLIPEIEADGGLLDCDLLFNNYGDEVEKDVWVQVRDLDPKFSVQIDMYQDVILPEGEFSFNLEQTVPPMVPSGRYEYSVYIGEYPFVIDAVAELTFKKLPGGQTLPQGPFSSEGWELSSDLFDQNDPGTAEGLPAEFEISQVYPNPFNPTATVAVSLPEAAQLTVAVYDITGREITKLTNGMMNSGRHEFTLDGSALTSGVYFIRATVPGKLDELRKAVLVR